MGKSLEKTYGNRVRVRVCGIAVEENKILLLNHRLGPEKELWIPPGGEVQFGETMVEALQREYLEETGCEVEVGPLLFTYEFIQPPFHAVEFFFRIDRLEGKPRLGKDPETETQILKELKWVTFSEIDIMDKRALHGVFSRLEKSEDIVTLNGFLTN